MLYSCRTEKGFPILASSSVRPFLSPESGRSLLVGVKPAPRTSSEPFLSLCKAGRKSKGGKKQLGEVPKAVAAAMGTALPTIAVPCPLILRPLEPAAEDNNTLLPVPSRDVPGAPLQWGGSPRGSPPRWALKVRLKPELSGSSFSPRRTRSRCGQQARRALPAWHKRQR